MLREYSYEYEYAQRIEEKGEKFTFSGSQTTPDSVFRCAKPEFRDHCI